MSNKREYTFADETGDAKIVVYEVFTGIEVAFLSIHMDSFDFEDTEKNLYGQYVGFHYCREGRIEQEENNEFFYLMPGDCSITIQDRHVKRFHFPMKHYHGISISIDTAAASDTFLELEKYVGATPIEVAKHVCREHHLAILRSSEQMERIFAELYSVQENKRMDYLKIKLMELLYVLNSTEYSAFGFEETVVPRMQVNFVKQVAEYITQNINTKISVKDLVLKFGVSDTYLQNSFRNVYGMPVISFMRAQKMQLAAQLLIHTDRNVSDIAQEYGYENESKFSAAFKKIMGDTPSVYRKEHSKIKVL